MSTAAKRLFTPAEYLILERQSETRHEFYQGQMFAMVGASWEHTLIKDNLAREIGNRLKGGPCRVVTSDLRVKVSATGLYTYPDLVIVCGEPQFDDGLFDTLLNPRVLIEVLSESTEKYDRGAKFFQYRQLPSVAEFVLVAQDRGAVERYVRQDGESWVLTEYHDLAQSFSLASIPVEIPLAEIYSGVTFSGQPIR